MQASNSGKEHPKRSVYFFVQQHYTPFSSDCDVSLHGKQFS